MLDFQVLGTEVTLHIVSLAGPRSGHRSKTHSSAARHQGVEPSSTNSKAVVSTSDSVRPAPGCRCLPPACRKHISKILSVLTRRLRLRRYTRLGAGGGAVSGYTTHTFWYPYVVYCCFTRCILPMLPLMNLLAYIDFEINFIPYICYQMPGLQFYPY